MSIDILKNLYNYVFYHTHVVNNSVTNGTIIIRDENNEKNRVGKPLIQIYVRELHNDLLSDGPLRFLEAKDTSGAAIISDSVFQLLLLP